ncbi:MAG: DUF2891 domain-containing protein [Gemmataceae bacterium]|nr:DUF2891 domain-containing protein [Gemmataceae bacterium]
MRLSGLFLTLIGISAMNPARAGEPMPELTRPQASAFIALALKNIDREFPNKPEHVWNGPDDGKSPRVLHPAFFGCYDWHSSVHGHWMLVRLLKRDPALPEAAKVRAVLAARFTAENLRTEAEYFNQPNRKSFERMYGWTWLLKLAEELHSWDDSDARAWSKNLQPLADVIVASYLEFLPKQTYAIRTGVHGNTAFGLTFAHDYAVTTGNAKLRERIEERARFYYGNDADAPAGWEPGGNDFLSPSLCEADLMRRVLPRDEFRKWWAQFLPALPKSLAEPATVTDRSDPQLVHLDGLNLSRAWCLKGIAAALAADDPTRKSLEESAARHARAGLAHVISDDYAGEHWLASFAVYLLVN